MKVTSCLVLTEAVKKRDLTRHLTALRVGEFEVATGGGIWVAIRERVKKTKRDFKIEIVKKGLVEFGNRTNETKVDDGETEVGNSNVKYGDAQGAKLADLLKGLKKR